MNRFDTLAESWDDDPQKRYRADAVADNIRKYIPLTGQMKAMEFGSGTGLLSFALKNDLGQITLVDTSRGMLDVVEKKIEACRVVNMTALLLDLAAGEKISGEFDLIYTMMALHHIRHPDEIMAVFYEHLKPRGYLAVAELEKRKSSFHGPGFEGHDGFEKKELSQLAGKSGFATVHLCDCFVIERDINGTSESHNVFLWIGQKRQD